MLLTCLVSVRFESITRLRLLTAEDGTYEGPISLGQKESDQTPWFLLTTMSFVSPDSILGDSYSSIERQNGASLEPVPEQSLTKADDNLRIVRIIVYFTIFLQQCSHERLDVHVEQQWGQR